MSREHHREHAPTRRLHSVLFGAFALGLLLLPLPLGSNRPWAVGIFVVYFSLLAAACLVNRLRSGPSTHSVGIRIPLVLALLWLAWVASYLLPARCGSTPGMAGLLQLGLEPVCRAAVYPDGHAQVLLRTLLYLEVGLLTLLLVDSTRRAYVLLGLLLASGALLATLGTLAALVGTGFDADWFRIGSPGRASGPFVNPNHFAGYLELLLGLGIGGLVGLLKDADGDRSWRQWLRDLLALLLSARAMLRVALVVLVVALVTTQSRSGNVAFLIAMLAGCVIGAIAMPRPPRKLLILGASLLIVDLLIVSSWFGFERLAQRVGASASAAVDAGQAHNNLLLGVDAERTRVAVATLDIWRGAPWRGYGGGAFRALFPAHRPAEVSDRLYDHAHNDYAQLLAEFGLFGAAFALLVVGAALVLAVRAMRVRKRRSVQGVALGCVIALIALAVHSFSDFNLQIPANASLFTVVLALSWLCRYGFEATPHSRRGATAHGQTTSPPAVVMVAALLILPTVAVASTDLGDTCRAALAEPVRSVSMAALPALSAVDIRERRDAAPKDEAVRAQAAELAVTLSLRALALTARGQAGPASELETQLREQLADTVWRTQQSVRGGSLEAAQALLLMIRIHMLEPDQSAAACALLSGADGTGENAVFWYERALCTLRQSPATSLQALQQAAERGHVLAQESLAQLCLGAAKPDPACAVQWLCRAASAGHASAGAQAAWVLQRDAPSEHALVRSLYERGARAGDAVSANNLGELHETGELGAVDLKAAEALYGDAARSGLAEARLNLARLWLSNPAPGDQRRQQALALLRVLKGSRPDEVAVLVRQFGLQL